MTAGVEVYVKYRRKPVVVEAVLWTGENLEEVKTAMEGRKIDVYVLRDKTPLMDIGAHGRANFVYPGYWVFEDTDGQIMVYPPEKFEQNFEAAGDL